MRETISVISALVGFVCAIQLVVGLWNGVAISAYGTMIFIGIVAGIAYFASTGGRRYLNGKLVPKHEYDEHQQRLRHERERRG